MLQAKGTIGAETDGKSLLEEQKIKCKWWVGRVCVETGEVGRPITDPSLNFSLVEVIERL